MISEQPHDAAPSEESAASRIDLPDGEHPSAPEAPGYAEAVFGERLDLAISYADLLADTGVSHGLIGPREVPRLWERHIVNCAVAEQAIPEGATVVDVGSGAGLPGLCLAIARPDLTLHLVEPMARRTAWLEVAIEDLGLSGVHVHRGRAEEVDVTGSVITARAVSRLSTLSGWMAPLAEPDARMVALKGSSAEDEIARDRAAAQRQGWTDFSVERVGVPGLPTPTTVVLARFSGRKGGRRRKKP